jgi:hypothetical protein
MCFLFTATTPIKQAFYIYCIRVDCLEVKCLCGLIAFLGRAGGSPVYEAHVPQLPELHPEQEPPVPATLCGTPLAEVLKQAKLDILRRAGLWHRGHSATLSDWLSGRICSNLVSHSGQIYS